MKKSLLSFFIIILVSTWVRTPDLNAQDKETEASDPQGITSLHNEVIQAVDKALLETSQIPAPKNIEPPPQEDTDSDMFLNSHQILEKIIKPENWNKTMDLDFDETPLEGIFQTIGEAAEMNIVLDPVLKGKTLSLHVKKVMIPEALNIIADSCNLAFKKIGSSLFVTTKERVHSDTLTTRLIKLRYVKAADIKEMCRNILDTVNVNEDTNSVVVIGTVDEIRKVDELVKKIDVSQPQVVLEAKIIEVNKNALKQLGMQWSNSISANFQENNRPTSFDTTQSSTGSSPFKVYSLSRSPLSFEATLQILENDNKAKVLASPSIITLNNKESEIFVGDRIPYTITDVAGGVATTEVQWVEPGIRLKITPSIIDKDFVVVKIEPEVSYIYSFIGPQNQYPWVKTRNATASVRIQNNHPFILGGLLDQEEQKSLFKVPILGSIPILGKLFSYQTNSVTDDELIITVVPVIINQ